ncbi:MAG: flavodoxin family protein [Coriobacteriales bacterium]|jgi:multimeric flavodoxin WrbA|nr:flavodoxin family protein [Coriobacteriales bacterium]
MAKIIIINTTPRKGGNCEVLAKRILVGLADSDPTYIDFKEADIRYCQGCDWCKHQDSAQCIQKDDMGALVPELDSCDALVLLSPIYYGELTAQAKTFVDRSYPFFNPAKPNMSMASKGGKKFALVTTCGGSDEEYQAYDEKLAQTFAVCGFSEQKVLALGGGSVPGSLADDAAVQAKIADLVDWIKA